ncbi:MAG: sulfatase-like hydrolase/transferase [Kiritimatiellia bacterium]
MSMNRPNILLITDDQHRWDFVGTQTVPSLATPALDRLRLEGTTLTHAFANCPICMPTRFTWTTGLYATQGAAFLAGNSHDWPLRIGRVNWGQANCRETETGNWVTKGSGL